MNSYVVGFLFSLDRKNVLLIRKQKPDWQRGLLNGVGGKIERKENPYHAMVREFEEETGRLHCGWSHFVTLTGKDWEVFFWKGKGDLSLCKSVTEEHLEVLPVDCIKDVIPNLKWLIPAALDDTVVMMDVEDSQ